jgi:tetratricopeptide (TPR) repeat protein
MAGDDARAEQAYQALVQLQPDHPWAVGNLINLYERQRRPSASLPLLLRLADRRPHDLQSNHAAAVTLLAVHGDFERARPYAARVRAAGAPELAGQHLVAVDAGEGPAEVAWAHYFDAAEQLARRNVLGVNAEVARVVAGLSGAPPWLHGELVANAVQYYLTTGQARKALGAAERFRDRGLLYPYYRAVLAYWMDDHESARQSIRDIDASPTWHNLVWLMARLGLADHAERWLRSLPDRTPLPGFDNLIAGHLGLARGELDQAIPALERLARRPGTGRDARITADLADAWLKKGDTDRAIQVLQESLSGPIYDVRDDGPVGYLWIPNALLLAELCQDRPCRAQGASIVADVDRLLSQADPDYPQRRRLDRLKAGAY